MSELTELEKVEKRTSAVAQLGLKHEENLIKLKEEEAALEEKIFSLREAVEFLEEDIVKKKAHREIDLERLEAEATAKFNEGEAKILSSLDRAKELSDSWNKIEENNKEATDRLTKVIEREHLCEEAEGKNKVRKEELDDRETKVRSREEANARSQMAVIEREEKTFADEEEHMEKSNDLDKRVLAFESKEKEINNKVVLNAEESQRLETTWTEYRERREALYAGEEQLAKDQAAVIQRRKENEHQEKVNEATRLKLNKAIRDKALDDSLLIKPKGE